MTAFIQPNLSLVVVMQPIGAGALYFAAILLIVVGIAHSYLGERSFSFAFSAATIFRSSEAGRSSPSGHSASRGTLRRLHGGASLRCCF